MTRTIIAASAVALALILGNTPVRAEYTPLTHGVFAAHTDRAVAENNYRSAPSASSERRSTRTHRSAAAAPRHASRHPAPRRMAYVSRPRPVQRPVRSAHVARGGGQSGMASYYWQPQRLASGGVFNPRALTAAHRSLPFGTRVRVTNARTGRSVNVTINDRGPFVGGRIIDLSTAAAGAIGMRGAGVARVTLQVLGR